MFAATLIVSVDKEAELFVTIRPAPTVVRMSAPIVWLKPLRSMVAAAAEPMSTIARTPREFDAPRETSAP